MTQAQRDALTVRNKLRQKCRTDLLTLCKVLDYKDVIPAVHAPILDVLQKFVGGEDSADGKYKPFKQHWELEGPRRTLILYPRGHLKTTIVTIAHTLQWIINYPNIRILLSMATGDQAEKVMRELKAHLQFNASFRALFPEFCPPREKVADFGSRDEFIVPCRTQHRKEPTVWTCTVGKTIAGVHPDIIKNSDLVDKENVKTPGGLNDVISHFRFLNPLLERYEGTPPTTGWNDVEGTKYDFGDLHNVLEKSPDWENKIVAGAHNEDYSKILWPQRHTKETLKAMQREMGDWVYSAQMLNKCIPTGDGLCDPKDIAFIPENVIRQLQPRLRMHCTIDLAGMEQTKSGDDTVLTVQGFDSDGRMYVPEINCGQFPPEEVIDLMFTIKKRYPQIIYFKIEKDAHARVLLPFLKREMSKRGVYLMILELKRDTHVSKQQRIKSLRPWFKNSLIRFSDGIPLLIRHKLLDQIAQFPSQSSGVHDDILDTLADGVQDGEGGVSDDVVADSPDMKFSIFGQAKPRDRFLGFREDGVAQWLYGDDSPEKETYAPTGIM